MLDVRKNIISFFKKVIFPYEGNVFETKVEESEEESEEEEKERVKKCIKYIENVSIILRMNQRE